MRQTKSSSHEHHEHAASTQRIEEQAREWVVRLFAEGAALDERLACERWRHADSRHDAAYRQAERLWHNLGQWKELADLEPLERSAVGARIAAGLQRAWSAHAGQITFAGAATATLIVAVVAVDLFDYRSSSGDENTISTQAAQTREVTLPDGSTVTLGARSTLSVAFTGAERRVKLSGGDAFFSVAKDPHKPFFVEAGAMTTRVLGTQFDVHYGPEQVRVAVLTGVVEVTQASARQILNAGQEAVASRASAANSFHVRAIGPERPGAWRSGRLIYVDANLAEIVGDANRYSSTRIEFGSPQLSEMRLTTSFRTDEIDRMIDTLERTLPLSADRSKPGVVTLQATESAVKLP